MNPNILKKISKYANIYHPKLIPSMAIQLTTYHSFSNPIFNHSLGDSYSLYESGLLIFTELVILKYGEDIPYEKRDEDIDMEIQYILFPIDMEMYRKITGIYDSIYEDIES